MEKKEYLNTLKSRAQCSWFKTNYINVGGSLLIALLPLKSYGTAYQIFPNLAYENPAELNSIHQAEVILGMTIPTLNMKFSGFVGPRSGSANTHQTPILPNGRVAWRLTSKVVTSFDITSPIIADIFYQPSSIVASSNVNTILRDVNYSPKISYQITKSLAAGLGFDANQLYNAQLNFITPPFGKITNKGHGWAYGWDAGLNYVINKTTFANLSYYSKISHTHITGRSTWGPVATHFSANYFIIPSVLTLNLVHLITKSWVLSATGRYMHWSDERTLQLFNTAIGNLFLPLHYNDSWSAQLATRYQLREQWAIKGAVVYGSSPQPTAYRPIALPSYEEVTLGAGVEYAINKCWSAQAFYAHVFSHPPINTTGVTGPILGNVKLNVDVFDFNVTWKI